MTINVVDSSGWIEYLTAGPNADNFAAPINDIENLVVPAIAVFEIVRLLLRQRGETQAKAAIAQLTAARIEPLDAILASDAAILSLEYGLAMADSIILATARSHGAELWTQDVDFEGLPNVRYFAKP